MGDLSCNPAQVPDGTDSYVQTCAFRHGVPGVDRGGNIPNLGDTAAANIQNLGTWLFKAPAPGKGYRPTSPASLAPDEAEKVEAFILGAADAMRGPQRPLLQLDLDVHARRQIELHQRVDRLVSRVDDVHQALVGADLELVT